MRIDLFRMERTQCLFENEVALNLSARAASSRCAWKNSSTTPSNFSRYSLKYPESDGSNELRDHIAKVVRRAS